MKELQGAAVQGTGTQSHRAMIRPDKCLLSEDIRKMFLTCFEIQGHEHELKSIIYFPEEVFREEISNKFVYFVPAVHEEKNENLFLDRFPVPIFMIEFTPGQKAELKIYAKRKKFGLFDNYFKKPKISISFDQREEFEEEENEENS